MRYLLPNNVRYCLFDDGGEMNLIDKVLDQIKKDVASEDMTHIAEMLTHVANRHLEAYLPEDLDLFNAYYNKETK